MRTAQELLFRGECRVSTSDQATALDLSQLRILAAGSDERLMQLGVTVGAPAFAHSLGSVYI